MSLDPAFEKKLRTMNGDPVCRTRSISHLWLLSAFWVVMLWGLSSVLLGDETAEVPTEGGASGDFVIQAQSEVYEEPTKSTRKKSEPVSTAGNGTDAEEGLGAMLRVDHLFGDTVGRTVGITPIEVMPYSLYDNDLWFGNMRFFPNDKGRLGGNAGFGYRYFDDTISRVYGGSVWYDLDSTSGATFQQVGLSFETYGDVWDARTNLYLPVGKTSDTLQTYINPGSPRYSDHWILYDRTTMSVAAMAGLDSEAGIPIPGELGDKHDLRAYAGFYHFTKSEVPEIWGWRTRLEANITPQVEVQVQGSGDQVYGTNLMVGVAWTYSGGIYARPEQARKSAYGRMGEAVRRNYNIVSPEQREVENGLKAINPDTGNPYIVQHVDSNASGASDGTNLNPYLTIGAAQAAGGDIYLVHADSVLAGADAVIVMQSGTRLFGDGATAQNWIPTTEYQNFLMPHATAGTNLPTLLNASGDAITLASNSTVAGFRIETPMGAGIFADGITGSNVRDITVVNAGGNGIDLRNSSGTFAFQNTQITGGTQDGLRVSGGDATVNYAGAITSPAGKIVSVENTTGGTVDLTGATLSSAGGGGVSINNAAGNVTIKDLTLTNTVGNGVDVIGGTGTFRFLGQTNMTNVGGVGVNLDGLASGGLLSFSHLWMDQRQDVGIQINNLSGGVQFQGNTVLRAASGITSAAIDFQNSSGNATFNNLDIVGGGTGIQIGDLSTENTGTFQVDGVTSIAGVSGPGISITDDSASILFHQVEIANRQAEGILIDRYRGYAQFLSPVGVSNDLGSTDSAIVFSNSTGDVRFVEANVSNSTGSAGVSVLSNTGSVLFEDLNITSHNGIGLFAQNGGTLYVYDGDIQTTDASAADLQNTNLSAQFTTISSNGGAIGLRLKDTTGTFEVLGGSAENSGGTIQGTDRAVVLDNASYVSLQKMLLYNNRVGIDADNSGVVNVNSLDIKNSTDDAIQATNTDNLIVQNSSIWNDSSAGSSSVVVDYDQVGTYQFSFLGNSITSQHKDAVTILGNSGSAGSTLALTVSDSLFNTDRVGDSGIDMTWRGATTGSITSSTFQADDGSNIGIKIDSLATSQNLNLAIGQNQFTYTGGSDTGLSITAAGTSQLNFSENQFDLYGNNSKGMVFDLKTTSAAFSTNVINGHGDVTNGILFNNVSAPSAVSFNRNSMTFASNSSVVHEGITFTNVNDVTSSDKVTLSGSQNNILSGASSNFVAPVGSTNGQFKMNGVFGP